MFVRGLALFVGGVLWAGMTGVAAHVVLAASQDTALSNPTPATEASIEAGRATYERRCQFCHAPDGTGGRRLEEGAPASDLTDDTWDFGETDGEIFSVIMYGVPPDYVMAAWEDRLTAEDVWHLVNYIRTFGPAR